MIASVPPRITPPLFLCCICIPLDIKVPPLKEVIAFLPQSPGSIVPANQGLLLLNVCAYDAPPLPLRPPSNGQISPHNITRCCLVTRQTIVLLYCLIMPPPQLIVVCLLAPSFQRHSKHLQRTPGPQGRFPPSYFRKGPPDDSGKTSLTHPIDDL